jgi:hypothetical protein
VQKGKAGLSRLWRGSLAVLGFLILLLGCDAGRCGGIPGLPPWTAARGGALEPVEHIGVLDLFQSGGYIGLVTSGSRPYGIRDLSAYHLLLCGRGAGWGLSAEWETLRYPHYKRDRFAVSAGIERLLPRMSVVLESKFRREGVTGFPKLSWWRLDGTVLLDCHLFMIAVSCPTIGDRNGRVVSLGCSAGSEVVTLAFNSDLIRGRWIDLRSGFRVAFCPSVSFMAGYRFETDEISFGLVTQWARMLVVLSWSHHPVVGQTIALGVGRLWLH